jgi:hypothetical protein
MRAFRVAVLLAGLITFAVAASDMAFTYHNFTFCSGACDRNPIINELVVIFGSPAGVWVWLPIEFAFLFSIVALALFGFRGVWVRMVPK